MEENSLQYFPSESLKYVCVKKYARTLDLNLEDVIPNLHDIDPTPSLLKKE
jgi:hypothetical protein